MIRINENRQSFMIATSLIFLALITRFIPGHPFNFTAIGAMALFSGATFKDKKYSFLLPIVAMFISDMIIGFHFSILPVYACFAFTVWMGIRIRNNISFLRIGAMSLLCSIVFFLVTNLPLWYLDLPLYPMTLQGTMDSYRSAIPFFRNQVLGDLFFNFLLFGIYYLLLRRDRRLQSIKNKH
jgi:hypothetical protein